MQAAQINVGRLWVIVYIKSRPKIMYVGIVKRKTLAWPSWSAFRDQSGEKTALINAAPVEIVPASVYEFVS